jgi:hypothetical protein
MAEMDPTYDIAIRMDGWCILRKGRVKKRLSRFVVHLDGGKRPADGIRVIGSYYDNGFALITHNVSGQHGLIWSV